MQCIPIFHIVDLGACLKLWVKMLTSDKLQCLQLWLRLGVMAYFLLCMGLLWLVRSGTCAANQFVDTGVMPMHVRLATVLLATSAVACDLFQMQS